MEQRDIAKRLLIKSKESFMLAVEIYNRPSLRYHAEACSMLLCNAWELMLKAHLVKTRGIDSIYYQNQKGKTISLSDCLKRIKTNENDPVRINMDKVIEFRNTNTHFITEEYEIFIGPFLQACVNNYAGQLFELHDESVSDLIPENYLALTVRRGVIDPEVIKAKYDPHVAAKILQRSSELSEVVNGEGSDKIAVAYETNLRLVKKRGDADLNVYVDKDADQGVAIVKDVRDSSSYYPYNVISCAEKATQLLKKAGVEFYHRGNRQDRVNKYIVGLFISTYSFKSDQRYGHDRSVNSEKSPLWSYSQQAVDLIVSEIKKDPENCLDKLKEYIDQRK